MVVCFEGQNCVFAKLKPTSIKKGVFSYFFLKRKQRVLALVKPRISSCDRYTKLLKDNTVLLY